MKAEFFTKGDEIRHGYFFNSADLTRSSPSF